MADQPIISETYRRLQSDLHAANPTYGKASGYYAQMVAPLVTQSGTRELLDYGAGKGLLAQRLAPLAPTPPVIHHYVPAVPEWSAPPAPCDLVACIDVLEHVEPEFLDNVLDDLVRVTRAFGFFTVHCGPAKRVLSD